MANVPAVLVVIARFFQLQGRGWKKKTPFPCGAEEWLCSEVPFLLLGTFVVQTYIFVYENFILNILMLD